MAAVFERAAAELKAANVAVSDAHKLQLSSWHKLNGTSQQDAKRRYVQLVKTLLPSFRVTVEEHTVVEPPKKATQPRQEVPGRSSWPMQLLLFLPVGAVLLVAIKVALPWTLVTVDEELTQKLPAAVAELMLLMFVVGQSFPWPEGLRFSSVATTARSQGRRRRRRAPVESELDVFLRKHGVQVVRQPEEGYTVPRLVLKLPEDQDAFQFGDCNATIPYTVEQTADVYYRKFKEPLPDPASRLLASIEVLEERHLDEFCAVFKRRLLRFRNEAPSLIKRFASSDFVEYIEDSLLDKQNRVRSSFCSLEFCYDPSGFNKADCLQLFYVYVKNESFQSLGVLEDFSVYKADADKSHW
ncbi:FERM/acyl-CoA-binding protein, 3-helical bundle [Phytophthora cactorum]|nr:FERM/acyl-CoA-binding protein, 3-helical bundle [Phytophthora cactorum]